MSGLQSDLPKDLLTVPETAGETTAKPSLPQLPPEEPAAAARAETPHATPPAAESSTPKSNIAVMPEAAAAPITEAAPEKVERGIGVLLVNLGTPDAPDAAAVRRYLKQFLTDPRVIEKRGLFWKLLLNGVILPIRSRRKARDYKQIWNNDKTNRRSRPSRGRRPKSSPASWNRSASTSSSTGRCVTPIRRSPRGSMR